MKHSYLLEILLVMLVLIAGTALIAVTGTDLAVTAPFYREGKWPVGDLFFWQMLYRLDRLPSIGLGIAALAGFLASFRCARYYRFRRAGAFLVVLLIIGPGILVNSILKEHWGRPRPREIVEFGGKKQFLHPWQKGEDGKGRSFPSGHASAAFYMAAPYLVYRRTDRRRAYFWLAGGMLFGVIMSMARITQGAHFVSDTLWAFGIVALCALVLAALFNLDKAAEPSQ